MKYFYYSILTVAVVSLIGCSTPNTATNVSNTEVKKVGFETKGILDYNFSMVTSNAVNSDGQDSYGKYVARIGQKKYYCKWSPSFWDWLMGVPKC